VLVSGRNTLLSLTRNRRFVTAAATALLAFALLPQPADAATTTWVPPQNARWQYQLSATSTGSGTAGGITISPCKTPYTGGACVSPQVYDIDLYAPDGKTVNTAAVTAIHNAGAKAICYVDAGTWEDWRPDAASYPASVRGAEVDGWEGENWLDISKTSVLLPLIEARVVKCANGGFDAVEFDNVDGYDNDSGFPLTSAQQVTFNKAIAGLAHKYQLSAGLKNDLAQVSSLVSSFDFAVNEECQYYTECADLKPFLSAGKAVFQVEYTDDGGSASAACPAANSANRNAIIKELDLTATPWTPCR
jgi:hypothetical protein